MFASRSWFTCATAAAASAVLLGAAIAQDGPRRSPRPSRAYPAPTAAWPVAALLLGRPTDRSVVLTVLPAQAMEAYVEYGAGKRTPVQKLVAGQPSQIDLSGLDPDAQIEYRLRYRPAGASEFAMGSAHRFRTARSPGKAFSFYVQGDSHPERNPKMNIPALYERTLLSAAAEPADFFVCMGDDFSVDNLPERTQATVEGAYRQQAPYLGLVAHSAPLFLVNGNHEQASRANLDGTQNNVAVWAQNARERFFAQPAPDAFYSGNAERVEHIGLLRDYYAWTWGDALFVVIDPYWHSPVAVDNALDGGSKRRDLWQITLGDTQYRWLAKTLESSHSKYKFVFTHHVNGTGRGGMEVAPLYEWGGKNPNGKDEFASRRPGWPMPIHQLMVKNGVSVFFQGHDHIFAKETLDGVVYQTTPVPADASNEWINADAYPSAEKVVGAGLVRVTVAEDRARVEFRRAFLPSDETNGRRHFEVAFAYDVAPRGLVK